MLYTYIISTKNMNDQFSKRYYFVILTLIEYRNLTFSQQNQTQKSNLSKIYIQCFNGNYISKSNLR